MRLLILVSALVLAPSARAEPPRVLRVCADPNNLPFSSEQGSGFENEIAKLIAKQLRARLEYTWWAQRRGFFRNTLKAQTCDVVIGVPTGLGMARTTAPYYRSSYAFVTRADRKLAVRSLADERLRTLRIGIQLVGDDGRNPPPAHALAARGIVDNVVGFVTDYRDQSPAAEVLRALEAGSIDVAIAWGPLAGGYAKRARTKLVVTPIAEASDHGQPMQFDIALAVRHKDRELATQLDRVLRAKRKHIAMILDRRGVPLLALDRKDAR